MTPPAPVRDETLVRRLTLLAVCLLLAALACSTDPARILGDTKLDLTVNPLGFLYRALYLWDPSYFGQLQNQAYGYLFPNGPFHALLVGAGVPEWVVQRLWLAALLCAAFTGTVAVARALRIGSLPAQVVAGIAFALSPRALTLLSYNSAELQPTLLLPWVLLPLIHGTRPGADPRRAALLSAAAFLLCGGTNAASELAVLTVPLLYLLTRAPGRRKRTLLAWWPAAIGLVSFWWLAPLLVMGRYVFSFMPFTEDAATTTSVTSLLNTVRGASNWMGYVPGSSALPAGSAVATTPWLVLATALVAALGLAGAVHRRNPERLFLGLSVLAGTAVVAAGYTGPLGGLPGPLVQDLLDGALSPFRNVHKFDVLIRLPVALGLAHLPAAAARRPLLGARPRLPAPERLTAAACTLAVLATLTPLATVGAATRGSFTEIPDYWYQATAWLDDRSGGRTTMAVPGSARGEYLWGRPMDEPMQPLMTGPWTNQQIIPWGSAGVSRLTHAVDQRLSAGQGSPGLAAALARMGVRYLLVRNDLQREGNNGGWPARVHQALADSPGIDYVRSFGPVMGSLEALPAARWYDQPYRALDVYRVADTAPLAGVVPADTALRVTGGPEALLAMAEHGLLTDDRPVLVGDDPGADRVPAARTVTADTLRRVEVVYPDVRRNTSATLTADEDYSRDVPAPDVVDPAWQPYTATVRHDGIAAVTASSAESGALAVPARRNPGRTPYAALDGSAATSWRSSSADGAVGEWLEVVFTEPRDVTGTTVTFERLPDTPPPSKVTVTTDHGSAQTELDPFTGAQELAVPEGRTSRLRVRVDALAWQPAHPFGTRVGIVALAVPGLHAERVLTVPGPADTGTLLFTGSAGALPGCMRGSRVWTCHPDLAAQGEDARSLDRTVTLSADAAAGDHAVTGQVTVADPQRVERAANRAGGYPKVTSSSTSVDHPAAMGRAAFDGDDATVWYPDPAEDRPSLDVDFGKRVTLSEMTVEFPRGDTVTRPVRVVLDTGKTVREGLIGSSGRLTFAELRTRTLRITFDPPRDQPLEIAEIDLPGVRTLGPVPDTDAATACGQGPRLLVNGTAVETRITGGTLRDQAEGRPPAVRQLHRRAPAGGRQPDHRAGEPSLPPRHGRRPRRRPRRRGAGARPARRDRGMGPQRTPRHRGRRHRLLPRRHRELQRGLDGPPRRLRHRAHPGPPGRLETGVAAARGHLGHRGPHLRARHRLPRGAAHRRGTGRRRPGRAGRAAPHRLRGPRRGTGRRRPRPHRPLRTGRRRRPPGTVERRMGRMRGRPRRPVHRLPAGAAQPAGLAEPGGRRLAGRRGPGRRRRRRTRRPPRRRAARRPPARLGRTTAVPARPRRHRTRPGRPLPPPPTQRTRSSRAGAPQRRHRGGDAVTPADTGTETPMPQEPTGTRPRGARTVPPRTAGLLTAALGAFCATVALLLPAVAAPRLALLPAPLHQTWTLTDPEAAYLDTAHWRTREDVPLVRRTETLGAPVPGEPGLLVLAVTVTTESDRGPVDHHEHRLVVDRATGRTVDCCGADPAPGGALAGLWPPGSTGAELPLHDPDTGAAPELRLDGTEQVAGLTVHRYTQHLPPTRVPGSLRDVPASALDADGGGTVRAERWVEATRTYWVEPVSGQVVDLAEQRRETLRTPDGDHEALLLDADLRLETGQAAAAAHHAGERARLLTAVRGRLPLLLGALGAALVAAGTVLVRRAARTR